MGPEELEGGRLLRGEERPGVTSRREVDGGVGGQRGGEGDHAGVERIIGRRGHADRRVGQSRSVRHRVVGREVGR